MNLLRREVSSVNRGFTLVELLIVIGIIVALVAMLVPAVGVARDRARSAQCQNNQREIGIAVLKRRTQSKAPFHSASWSSTVVPLLDGESSLLHCPAHVGSGLSYGMNDRSHRMQSGDSSKILLMDYKFVEILAVKKRLQGQNWATGRTGRHRGYSNILRNDGTVISRDPDDYDPRICKNFVQYWRPMRDFSIVLEDCAEVGYVFENTAAGGAGTEHSGPSGYTTPGGGGGGGGGGGCGVMGQKVRIWFPGQTRTLNFAEAQVFTYNGDNIATTGTATQINTTHGGVASRANDGNTNGNWGGGSVQHTSNIFEVWWELDFGSEKEIHEIVVWRRTDCCGNRTHLATVDVIDENGVVVVSQQLGTFSGGALSETIDYCQ